jgi:hypothetical protein
MQASASLLSGDWASIVAVIGEVVDLEATARQFKALQRRRKIRSAAGLLRLAMIWGPGRQSLREAAALAGDCGIADLSDKAVEGRLRKMGDWLEHLLSRLLARRLPPADALPADALPAEAAIDGGLDLSLVDGSLICSPGKGQDWRLHARYDPDRGRFADLVLTTTREAEAARRTRVGAGRVHVMDRGYARARDFQAVLRGGGDFITRTSWRSVKLFDAGQRQLDLISRLEGVHWPHEEPVWVEGIARPLRLLIRSLPPEAAERQRARRIRRANRRCQAIDPRTIQAAGFLMLLTSLPADRHASEQVFDAYRDRWQIEIGFKRLKTLGRLDELPSSDPVLARTWLLAQLIAAVLTDDLANEIAGFSP